MSHFHPLTSWQGPQKNNNKVSNGMEENACMEMTATDMASVHYRSKTHHPPQREDKVTTNM
eukprot:355883-Amphidinium_carterae.1